MTSLSRLLAGIAVTAAFSVCARADLVTWGTVQTMTGPSEVSLNGTLVAARNPWNGTSSSPVVNGVTFTAFSPTGWPNGGNTLFNGSTSGDAAYDTLMSTSRATSEVTQTNPTGWGGIRIDNLGTQVIGNTYEIQVWFSDQRPGLGTGPANTDLYDRQMVLSSATGAATLTGGIVTNLGSLTQGTNSGILEADPNNTAGAGDTMLGSYCIGTYTRTSTDQIWLIVQGAHPTATNILRPNVNAFQIREVPSNTPTTPFCLGDGTGAACPCANSGTAGNGCANSSFASGASLSSAGIAGASAGTDTLVLTASNIPGPGLFFQATGTVAAINFGDGHLCAASGIVRLGVVFPTSNVASYPGGLTPNPIHIAGGTAAGDVRHYQCWYRDAVTVCGGATHNLTQGLTLTWAP